MKRVTYDEKNPAPIHKRTTMSRDELAEFFPGRHRHDAVGRDATSFAGPEREGAAGAQLVERQQLKFDAMNIDRKAGCKLAGTCRSTTLMMMS